jgi:creatinine amidohydrolase
MNHPSRFWCDLSTRDFATALASGLAEQTVAVLPVAAIEQHGPHLPTSVDADLLNGVIHAALPLLAPELPVLVLPTQAVGRSIEHEAFPGTLSLSAATIQQVWMELGASVARAGIRRLLILNGHGGQVSLMDIVARDLRGAHQMLVLGASWFSLPLEATADALFSREEQRFGMHAGDIETSMMLALAPAHVHMDLAQNFASSSQARAAQFAILGNGRSAKLGWHIQDINTQGAAGNASAATAAKGQAMVDAAARQLALLLQEFAQLPLSTLARS